MKSVLVFSTGEGAICPGCGASAGRCTCKAAKAAPRDGTVRISRETKGRKGKGVTLITGVPLGSEGLAALAKDLKQRCGTGGTVKDGVIEIQGDHRDRLVAELQGRGFRVKRAAASPERGAHGATLADLAAVSEGCGASGPRIPRLPRVPRPGRHQRRGCRRQPRR